MTDDLRTRITAVIADSLLKQSEGDGYAHRYTPLDDEGNDLPERIGLDSSIDPAAVADAVIAELGLRKFTETGEVTDRDGGPSIKYRRVRWVTDWKADE